MPPWPAPEAKALPPDTFSAAGSALAARVDGDVAEPLEAGDDIERALRHADRRRSASADPAGPAHVGAGLAALPRAWTSIPTVLIAPPPVPPVRSSTLAVPPVALKPLEATSSSRTRRLKSPAKASALTRRGKGVVTAAASDIRRGGAADGMRRRRAFAAEAQCLEAEEGPFARSSRVNAPPFAAPRMAVPPCASPAVVRAPLVWPLRLEVEAMRIRSFRRRRSPRRARRWRWVRNRCCWCCAPRSAIEALASRPMLGADSAAPPSTRTSMFAPVALVAGPVRAGAAHTRRRTGCPSERFAPLPTWKTTSSPLPLPNAEPAAESSAL